MNKLRILQVNKFYPPVIGGVEKVVQQIAEGLSDRCDMKVLACQVKGPACDEIVSGIPVHRSASLGTFCSMPVSIPFLRDFKRLAADRDIVHIHMPFPLADLACFLSGYKGKIVVWWHSDVVRQKAFMPFYKPLMHWLLRRADKIIVATKGHINGSDYLPFYRDKCVVIPFAADAAILKDAQSYLSTKKEPATKDRLFQFLFIGRLVSYKGCDVLLDAFSQLHTGHLTIAGDGPEREKLLQQARKLNLDQQVTFLQSFDEEKKKSLYRECGVFVLPSVSKNEAFGLVQLEAMAYGKPVLNTKLNSGVPEVSLDQVTGLTVPPRDPLQLAQAMKQLMENPSLQEQMGLKATLRANTFSSEFTTKIYKLYQLITERNIQNS